MRFPAPPPVLPLLPLVVLVAGWGCGPTEVLVGDAPGVARVVAGVLEVAPEVPAVPQLDTAVTGDALEIPIGPPAGLVAFDDGSFYFADRVRRRIGHVAADGRLTWPAGRGICGAPGALGGDPTTLCLLLPAGLAVEASGALIISDDRGHRVWRFLPSEERVEPVLGTGVSGVSPAGTPGTQARTFGPADVAVGPDGSVYVAERQNHRIVRIATDGLLALVAGTGTQGDAGDGGDATAARLSLPEGVHWVGDTLYVADSGNHRIRRVVDGVIEGFAGIGAAGFAGEGAPASTALFNRPGRMASSGTLLFITDRGNNRVRVVQLGPDIIRTFGGTGTLDAGADLIEIGRTPLAAPAGVAVGGRAVFIADSGGFVVRRVVR